jgi:hypothetical protein
MSALVIWFSFLAKEISIVRKRSEFTFAVRQAAKWGKDQVVK